MAQIQLEFYTINIRKKNTEKNNKNYLTFGELDENIFDVVEEYIKYLETQVHAVDIVKKTLSFDNKTFQIRKKDDIISGIIQSGDYDSTGILKNIADKKREVQVSRTDSILKPFYYALYLPPKLKTGLFILQRTGIHSVHTPMKLNLSEFFSVKELSIDMKPFFPTDVLQVINQGVIQEITLTKYNITKDMADMLSIDSKDVTIQVLITAKNSLGNKINSHLTKFINKPTNGIFPNKVFGKLEIDGSEVVSIKANFKGKPRKYSLNTLQPFRPYENIDEKVEIGKDGHPTFESIDKAGRDFISDYKPKIKGL